MQDAIPHFGSVDWAANRHAACIVDATGHILEEFSVDHTAAGVATLVRQFQRQHVARVAIERPDGPIVEALLAAGLEVVVVASRAIKALRTRYGRSKLALTSTLTSADAWLSRLAPVLPT